MHECAYFSSLACPPGEILDRRAIGDINDFREQVIARVRKFSCDAIKLLRIAIDQRQRTPLRQTPGADAAHATNASNDDDVRHRSDEHTSELQSLMRISYAVFCLIQKPTHISYVSYPQQPPS